MAKKHYRRSNKRKIPILATAGAVATGVAMYTTVKDKGMPYLGYAVTGYDPGDKKIYTAKLVETYAPVALGVVGSMAASRLGLNRYLSHIPVFKL